MLLNESEFTQLKRASTELEGGMGAVAWGVLEMFRRAGLPAEEVRSLRDKMDAFFTRPTNEECNTILKVIEERLEKEKQISGVWYSS